jgi:hypothetical protein
MAVPFVCPCCADCRGELLFRPDVSLWVRLERPLASGGAEEIRPAMMVFLGRHLVDLESRAAHGIDDLHWKLSLLIKKAH